MKIHRVVQMLGATTSTGKLASDINFENQPLLDKKDIYNLRAELDDEFKSNARTIYERNTSSRINTNTGFRFRPFLASREEFFKGALMLENDTEIIIKDNLFFNTNLKYSVWDNFDDFIYLPDNNFPAQVRSDVKDYLRNLNDGVVIGYRYFGNTGTAQPPYHKGRPNLCVLPKLISTPD